MTAGRPRTPAHLKLVTGNPGKRKIQKEPQPRGTLTRPPHLVDKIGEEWDRVIAAMPPGFYTAADVPVLTIYCEAVVGRRNAMMDVQKDGRIVAGSAGQKAAHPMLKEAARQAEIILKCAVQLGMSPAARTRLTAPDEEKPDELESRYFG